MIATGPLEAATTVISVLKWGGLIVAAAGTAVTGTMLAIGRRSISTETQLGEHNHT